MSSGLQRSLSGSMASVVEAKRATYMQQWPPSGFHFRAGELGHPYSHHLPPSWLYSRLQKSMKLSGQNERNPHSPNFTVRCDASVRVWLILLIGRCFIMQVSWDGGHDLVRVWLIRGVDVGGNGIHTEHLWHHLVCSWEDAFSTYSNLFAGNCTWRRSFMSMWI